MSTPECTIAACPRNLPELWSEDVPDLPSGAVFEFELGFGPLGGADGSAEGVVAFFDVAEELEALAPGAGEQQDQAGGVDEGAVEGLGARGARLAGAAGPAEHDAAAFGEEELLLPGVGVHGLGAESFAGVEGEAELGG